MQFPSRYALLVVAPMSLWSAGCSAITHRPVAQARPAISTTDRLMSMAQVYEQKGQHEQAHKLYCQVLQENPNHPVAREHAANLMAAISNVHSAQDQASQSAMASNADSGSKLSVASVVPAPTDPALLGKQNRKILSEEEVAARVPKPRMLAKKSPAPVRESQVAIVTHQETNSGVVTPAQEFHETAAPTPDVALEEPLKVVEAPQAVELPATQPYWVEFASQEPAETAPRPIATANVAPLQVPPPVIVPQEAASLQVEFAELPVVTSNAPVIVVESARPSTWVKTSATRVCPGAPEHLQGFLTNLTATDPEARKTALEEIVNAGPAAATCVPAIRLCLSDVDPLVQAHAAWALWTITGQGDEAVRCLCGVLECNQEQAIAFACYVLGTMGRQAEPAISTLARLQDDDSNAIRVHASEAMLKVSGNGSLAIRVLTASLSSHRAEERSLAAVALGSAAGSHRQAAVSALITALYDADANVRCSAALAIGGFGKEALAAVSALEVAASATDSETRDAAATALACIRK